MTPQDRLAAALQVAFTDQVIAERDAIEAEAVSLCPFCKQCRVGTNDADRHDCGCEGPCQWLGWDDWKKNIEAEAVKPWREWVEQCGEHEPHCTVYGALSPGQHVPNPCSCGLSALLAEDEK